MCGLHLTATYAEQLYAQLDVCISWDLQVTLMLVGKL
jgi:hypothetical protein